ncbi:MAG: CDP-diacylglycerol--glycerol-3-phosphate 3-phosphatidyltransferase [Clostridia bacterium]|nr:CDP-diacylglycerol--glycerol-3-phosphate 3-phosphatidyltransferase [Clostridia bacterium]
MVDNEELNQQKTDQTKTVNQIWNVPNILTFSRILIIPIFVALFYVHFTGHYFVVWALFAIACFTDLFDGAIARKHNLVTNLGKFLDPIADKVLVLTGFILYLTVPQIFCANLGDWAIIVAGCGVAVIFARELIVSGFRMVAASSGEVIAADKIGKYKTFAQDLSVGFLVFAEGLCELSDDLFATVVNLIGISLFVVSIILTVASGVYYIVKNIHVLKK